MRAICQKEGSFTTCHSQVLQLRGRRRRPYAADAADDGTILRAAAAEKFDFLYLQHCDAAPPTPPKIHQKLAPPTPKIFSYNGSTGTPKRFDAMATFAFATPTNPAQKTMLSLIQIPATNSILIRILEIRWERGGGVQCGYDIKLVLDDSWETEGRVEMHALLEHNFPSVKLRQAYQAALCCIFKLWHGILSWTSGEAFLLNHSASPIRNKQPLKHIFRNTTAYGLGDAETNVSLNFSGDKFTFEGSINASRLFFVGDFVSNSYECSPFIPDAIDRYVGEDEYFAELKDLFVSLKFTLNTPFTGKMSITDYQIGFNNLFSFEWNFKNVTKVNGDARFDLND
ncbi:hypothetical protein Fcan01_19296 [Folsomia candida]|uniref:Uncharacterized protein n=1 Tax=Folsomia candida TaxID=158441 RepID=A0A226DKH5_FOLCA|nr:hypothetical protein Fcan01_19296 [Folsomia candida]